MSHRRLPNARGTVIRCDGCGAESMTGQVYPSLHRLWLYRTQGWARGQLHPTRPVADGHCDMGTTGKDLCPTCAEQDRAAAER